MHVAGRSISLDTGLTAHKLSVVLHTCSRFLALALAMALFGCGEREPEPETPAPPPPAPEARPSAAELTGWPAGIGRALVLRLAAPEDAFRLVVPELGDRRLADSALSVHVGDSIPIALLGHPGKVADAHLRVIDAESGFGSCVTWPAVEVTETRLLRGRKAGAWQIGFERDSVTAIPMDSLAGMNATDSTALTNAIHSVLRDVPALSDSTLRGIPFAILRAYRLHGGGRSIVAAELVRESRSEASPHEQRLFVVGERAADEQAHMMVYSQDVTGPADSTPVTDLLAAVVPHASSKPILAIGIEGRNGTRLHLLQRTGRREWSRVWASVVSFC
jgi:hypothetical protein